MKNRIKLNNSIRRKLRAVLPLLSLFVVIGVFWWLKLTGITLAGEAFCGMQEHVHGEECSVTLVCTETEDRIHTHGEDCYEQVLTCTLEETEEHTHGEDCYSQSLVCELAEFGPHTHSDDCYESSCGLKAHTHGESCYSDLSADLETADDWEATLADIPNNLPADERLVAVARSQLGYCESQRNYVLDEAGERCGITRYGQWYGNPYGKWSAAFVSFCLRYGGLEHISISAGAETLHQQWQTELLYLPAAEREAKLADILFLDKDGNGNADAVAVVAEVTDGGIAVIEGDVDGSVAEVTYDPQDPAVMGYGRPVGDADDAQHGSLLAAADTCTLWFDGTNGDLMSLQPADKLSYSATIGSTYQLPTTWAGPRKYNYVLRGWYDVKNAKYYPAGATYNVTGDTVFYAYWLPESYDFGRFNTQVANTLDESSYIRTRVFDYNLLFNVLSETPSIGSNGNVSWQLNSSGKVPYGNESLNFIFLDWDGSGDISMPGSRNDHNNNRSDVTQGIFGAIGGQPNEALRTALFATDNSFDPDTGTGVIGKQYLGEGNHLFQVVHDPNSPLNGYHYYDSKLNAASYNRSQGRFYVYNYLERTSDSEKDGGGNSEKGAYSDFLPFNSPYVGVEGQTLKTYSYAGDNGEYSGTTHYQYDAKYNTQQSVATNVGTNYSFGMSVEIDFFLPNDVGSVSNGESGNRDLYGNEMHFKFSGDDDVWVLLDGKLVLDVGGIHGVRSGDINFSTGVVTTQINDSSTKTATFSAAEGEHVLTVYYLERGSSQSNCSMYFNLAPRYHLSIQKEDVLTRHLLNGAEFSVFTDRACTIPAQLWHSKAENDLGTVAPTNTFAVVDGVANMWGFVAGETYYIKETKPPGGDNSPYSCASGLVSMHIDCLGNATYNVEVIEELDENGNPVPVGNGFTAYGFRIDEETQQAYLVVTNAPEWVKETTQVTAIKRWADTKDHSGDEVTVYMTVTDPDGTVRRLQNAVLSSDHNWTHTWTNLPKYQQDGVTPIVYGVEEEYVAGYYGTVEKITELESTTVSWENATSFAEGEQYLLKTNQGYLSATTSNTLAWVDEETAKNSELALWTASANGTASRLTNGAGQILVYNSGRTSSSRYFTVTTSTSGNNNITLDSNGRLYYNGSTDYYFSSINSNGRGSVSRSSALAFTRVLKSEETISVPVEGETFLATNTPLEQETSVKVTKVWNTDSGGEGEYETLRVTVRLLADGKDTGRTVTLSMNNGWTDTFRGLPYGKSDGSVIAYTVEEVPVGDNWTPSVSVQTLDTGQTPTYAVTVTNTYRNMQSAELPATGSPARLWLMLGGGALMAIALFMGIAERRKRERRGS